MKGKHPKRRKAKDNPYSICEVDGRYFLSFKDGEGNLQDFEITKTLYDIFNRFELDDLVYLNVWDRHIEHSDVWDNTLYERAVEEPISVEDMIIRKLEYEAVSKAIATLPEKQKKRLLLHYLKGMTFREIAEAEGCSMRAVEYSVHDAIHNLRKYFQS